MSKVIDEIIAAKKHSFTAMDFENAKQVVERLGVMAAKNRKELEEGDIETIAYLWGLDAGRGTLELVPNMPLPI